MPVRASPLHTSDERVMPMTLDVTNAVEIQGTAGKVESLDILVNNAGVDLHDDLSDRAGTDRHLAPSTSLVRTA